MYVFSVNLLITEKNVLVVVAAVVVVHPSKFVFEVNETRNDNI